MLYIPLEIKPPPQGSIAIFRNANAMGQVFYKKPDGSIAPCEFIQGNFRISPITLTKDPFNYTGDELEALQYDGIQYIFTLFKKQVIQRIRAGGGGGGSSGSTGIQGITVEDEGIQVNGTITKLDFIGKLVTVTDGGGGKANITIVIPSLTTAQRTALIPTTALIVEDTDTDQYYKWSTTSNSWSPF